MKGLASGLKHRKPFPNSTTHSHRTQNISEQKDICRTQELTQACSKTGLAPRKMPRELPYNCATIDVFPNKQTQRTELGKASRRQHKTALATSSTTVIEW